MHVNEARKKLVIRSNPRSWNSILGRICKAAHECLLHLEKYMTLRRRELRSLDTPIHFRRMEHSRLYDSFVPEIKQGN